MTSLSQLTRRLEDLEVTEQEPEAGIIICDEVDYERLRALHPAAHFIIDDIPKTGGI